MKYIELLARYFLVFWYFLCVYDGWAYLFFGMHPFGEPDGIFLPALMETTYFWVFLKIIQTVIFISLAFNFKPVLGFTLSLPISSIICLLYFFEIPYLLPMGVLIIVSTVILFRKYLPSLLPLLDTYSERANSNIKK